VFGKTQNLKIARRFELPEVPQFPCFGGQRIMRLRLEGLLEPGPTSHPTISPRAPGDRPGAGFSCWPLAPLRALPSRLFQLCRGQSRRFGLTSSRKTRSAVRPLSPRVNWHPGWAASVWSVNGADGSGRSAADVPMGSDPGSSPRKSETGQLPRLARESKPRALITAEHQALATTECKPENSLVRATPTWPYLQLQRNRKLDARIGRWPRQAQGRGAPGARGGTGSRPGGLLLAPRAIGPLPYGARSPGWRLTSKRPLRMAVANPAGPLPGELLPIEPQQPPRVARPPSWPLSRPKAPYPEDSSLLHVEAIAADAATCSALCQFRGHNFTSEVPLTPGRRQLETFPQKAPQTPPAMVAPARRACRWQGSFSVDGSGLDRRQPLTSRFVAALLLPWASNPFRFPLLASMAVAGKRGSLRTSQGQPASRPFLWQAGYPHRGAFDQLGYSNTSDGPRYVSLISNGAVQPNTTHRARCLRQVQIGQPLPAACLRREAARRLGSMGACRRGFFSGPALPMASLVRAESTRVGGGRLNTTLA